MPMENITQNEKLIEALRRIYDRFTQLASAKRERIIEVAKSFVESENDVVLKECFQLFLELLQDFDQAATEGENEEK